jgi:hypothetical protein
LSIFKFEISAKTAFNLLAGGRTIDPWSLSSRVQIQAPLALWGIKQQKTFRFFPILYYRHDTQHNDGYVMPSVKKALCAECRGDYNITLPALTFNGITWSVCIA